MNDFKGRHFTGEVILWAVRWYLPVPQPPIAGSDGAMPRNIGWTCRGEVVIFRSLAQTADDQTS